jgi:transposase, IS30 family
MRRRRRSLDGELRRQVISLAARGQSYRQILDQVDVSMGGITIVLRDWGGQSRSEVWEPAQLRLSLDERVEIRIGLSAGRSFAAIARSLSRATSTVSREVKGNGGRHYYRPAGAHRRARQSARRPRAPKLARRPALRGRVVADLEQLWSPEQIAHRLRAEFPGEPEMWVSHETIYQTLYMQGRGELRRELARCLRTGRAKRRPQGRTERRGRIPGMVLISERPAEVADRAVPGNWEGDLIIGKAQRSAIATLVERSTRFTMLARVENRTADVVRDAVAAQITTLPEQLRRSLTWDQGLEMAQHQQFRVDTGIDVYFCDPHSPWQRGSNENTNGLLRQYFPKGTDLSVHSQEHLDAVAAQLNGRPRQTLNWMTPSEKLAELLR